MKILSPRLIRDIAAIIENARQQVCSSVNSAMITSYRKIGRRLIEHEQQSEKRAACSKAQPQTLSDTLNARFGKGFDVTNLRNMRKFYPAFPIRDALRFKSSWTHYRRLIRIPTPKPALGICKKPASQHWSVRAPRPGKDDME